MLLRFLSALLLSLFYRKIEVIAPVFDQTIPTILIAMHPNGLVDGMLIYTTFPRFISMIVKDTLFKIPILGYLLRKLNCVPIQRPSDHSQVDNQANFARIVDNLNQLKTILIFPEGKSHDFTNLQSLRTGFLRIAKQVLKDTGHRSVAVIPVGLNYLQKERFRSEVAVIYGEPIILKAEHFENQLEVLMPRFVKGIEQITVVADEQQRLAASIITDDPLCYLNYSKVELTPELRESVEAYQKSLQWYGITDYQVRYAKFQSENFHCQSIFNLFYFLLCNLAILLLIYPFAWLSKKISDWLAGKHLDQIAHYRLLISLINFTLITFCYLGLGWYWYGLSSWYGLAPVLVTLFVVIRDQPIKHTLITLRSLTENFNPLIENRTELRRKLAFHYLKN